jgi:hypothetical protein
MSPDLMEAYSEGRRSAFREVVMFVRGLKQIRVHELFRGLSETGGEPDEEGWQDAPDMVQKSWKAVATAIERMK